MCHVGNWAPDGPDTAYVPVDMIVVITNGLRICSPYHPPAPVTFLVDGEASLGTTILIEIPVSIPTDDGLPRP
jgi:hypothetical protein